MSASSLPLASPYVFFLGIGGIGMSALAKYYLANGYEVSGYDLTPSAITESLAAIGANITFEDDVAGLPDWILNTYDPAKCVVIYTPAIPPTNRLFRYFESHCINLIKRSQALAELTKGLYTIAVAGTHGKTSTASMVSFLLTQNNIPHYAFLGGIALNPESNYVAPPSGHAQIIVVEADEFDRSFHWLAPDIAIVTSVDPDHLDIYASKEAFRQAFVDFAGNIKPTGLLIAQVDTNLTASFPRSVTYGFSESCNLMAKDIVAGEGSYTFSVVANIYPSGVSVRSTAPGRHNILNALAAIQTLVGLPEHLTDGMPFRLFNLDFSNYKGVQRRFHRVSSPADPFVLIDDYAHHPTEIEATLNTVRDMYPEHQILAIFQPHLYSRTKDFAFQFSKSLALADHVLLLPIYPARELPIDGVNSAMLAKHSLEGKCTLIEKDTLLASAIQYHQHVTILMGAGDIDRWVPLIYQSLKEHYNEL